ncbi:Severin [Fusarium beomiforme]|uniref:Severin n=1 Tax=Fusarium beomiforme TaxID=44412 RepID=A0A9P5DX77_9HYPO|nr:Severin [Fusarium beomiforme]
MAPNQGLVHPREYDIKDSNVELIGADIDHQVKYNSALTEPAWNDGKVGVEPGLFVWRIEQFEVIPLPKEKYGQFYDGDSYIVLFSELIGSNNGTEKLVHDIFFWLGKHTSQDEAGTAAYKTVELDEFLKGTATQHREIQEAPSDDFLTLFPRISIRSGGVESGFRHVEEEEQKPTLTLLRVFKNPAVGADRVIVHEVEPVWTSLDDTDVFVLDVGDKIWVWQGKDCSPMEKAKAAQIVHDMTVAKHSEVEVISQTESRSRRIVDLLGGDDDTPREGFHCKKPFTPRTADKASKKLFRLSDSSGQLSFGLVKEAERILHDDLESEDVFLLDDGGRAIWVWQGSGSSAAEKKNWFKIAQAYVRYLQAKTGNGDAYLTPVAKVVEGGESRAFTRALAA